MILFILIMMLFAGGTAWADASVNVPLAHWAYPFLDRLEARCMITGVRNGSRPLSRKEMVQLLRSVEARKERLSAVEQRRLERLIRRFGQEERHKVPKTSWFSGLLSESSLYQWHQGTTHIYIEPLFRYRNIEEWTGKHRDNTAVNMAGGRIWGTLKGTLGFYARARDGREQSSKGYPLCSDTLISQGRLVETGIEYTKSHSTYVDHKEADAYLVFELPWFDLEFGKDSVIWGPGYRGTLALFNHGPSFPMLKLRAHYGAFKLTSLTGQLLEKTGESTQAVEQLTRKYIAAHRLEFTAYPGIDIGLGEAIIYANRSIEPLYLNPIMFYRAAEHYLGNRDNATLFADIDINLIRGFKAYGELFIDDLYKSRLGTDWYGNKFAYLTGILWTNPFRLSDTDVRVEYVHIDPWVYTHKDSMNSYQHREQNLGHWLGPNADNLYAEVRWWFAERGLASVFFEQERQGQNEPDKNVGGDAGLGHRPYEDTLMKKFLDGILEKRRSFGGIVSYEATNNLFIHLGYRRIYFDNIDLEGNDIRENRVRNEVSLGLEYNYFSGTVFPANRL